MADISDYEDTSPERYLALVWRAIAEALREPPYLAVSAENNFFKQKLLDDGLILVDAKKASHYSKDHYPEEGHMK